VGAALGLRAEGAPKWPGREAAKRWLAAAEKRACRCTIKSRSQSGTADYDRRRPPYWEAALRVSCWTGGGQRSSVVDCAGWYGVVAGAPASAQFRRTNIRRASGSRFGGNVSTLVGRNE